MSDFRPKKRKRGIKIEEFQGEVLVYDLESHHAHCLNATAARVWNLCDGHRTVADIAARIALEDDSECNEDLVWHAVSELEKAALFAASTPALPLSPGRREALGKLAWSAAIPLVLSIAVPTPTAAQSVVTVVTVVGTPGITRRR